ncbi:MAG: hypothetical protein HYZ47_04495, partial [Simkania negevensis]|nr:hypothetical protein [Simkania negevensis]
MFKLAITQTVWMLSFFFFLQGSLPAEENKKGNAAQVSSDEEAFLIRRIAEFWKDGDYSIVKTQILEFFDKFPQSQHKGFFYGILGDIYVQEKAFEKALNTYHQIKDPKTVEKILLNKLHCYYELDQFQQLTKEAAPYLTAKSEEIEGRKQELHFLLAEGFFRQALTEQDPQQKEALAKKAKPLYEKLAGTSYEETSQYAIAEIYAILGENEKAAGAYVALTVSHPEMKEDLLFQAATLQAHFDPAKAVDTFHQVVEIRGNRVKEATFNLAVLLYQTGRYEELAQKGESISSDIPAESRSTFDFILGKSFFALEDYKKSVDPMERFIDSQYVPGDQLKNGLLTQMTSAYKLTNEPLFNRSFEKFDMLFPKDVEMPKAIFMHAMLLKEEGASSRADERMQVIKEKYKEFSSQENVIFEYGLISHQNERWFD